MVVMMVVVVALCGRGGALEGWWGIRQVGLRRVSTGYGQQQQQTEV